MHFPGYTFLGCIQALSWSQVVSQCAAECQLPEARVPLQALPCSQSGKMCLNSLHSRLRPPPLRSPGVCLSHTYAIQELGATSAAQRTHSPYLVPFSRITFLTCHAFGSLSLPQVSPAPLSSCSWALALAGARVRPSLPALDSIQDRLPVSPLRAAAFYPSLPPNHLFPPPVRSSQLRQPFISQGSHTPWHGKKGFVT